MKFFKKFLLIALSALLAGVVFGQDPISEYSSNYDKPVQLLPPAPNAASLGKYGGIQLGLWSGSPNVNIPIFEYQSQNIKLPISISYSSTGFKVDEIASRVGMHWSLNAGGVITRTVNGSIDEQSERIFPPTGMAYNSQMINFMNLLTGNMKDNYDGSAQGPYGHFDGQPDLFTFNFNGYSGQFILDTVNYGASNATYKPVLLSYSNLKIERYNSIGLDYGYKITTPDGIQYFFQAEDFTTSYDTSGQAGCSYPYKQNVPTAWYLTKIVHPNKDSIQLSYTRKQFSYLTSASQTIYKHDPSSPVLWSCDGEWPTALNVPDLTDIRCLNKLKTDGAILDEITSTGGERIKFKYIDRSDYDDMLLSIIEVYQSGEASPCKIFNLSYLYPETQSYPTASGEGGLNKRPFLMSFTERSPDSTLTKTYSFLYNDFENLPPRLSYAQDHWGYFNGKSNSTLIPTPTTSTYVVTFPQANANREPDPIYSTKGLLNSITYPTGGKDSILYEGNQVYMQVPVQPIDTMVSAEVYNNNIFYSGEVYSNYAVISYQQTVTISGARNPNTTGDPSLSVTTVTLLDANGNVVFSKALNHTDPSSISFSEQKLLLPGSYRIHIVTLGPNNYGQASLSFKKGVISYEYKNVNSGGVRVSKVMTYDYNTDKTITKRYFYGSLTDPAISSGVGVAIPFYEKMLKLYKPCKEYDLQRYTCDDIAETQYFTMHSNSIFNLYSNGSLPTVYREVVESFGDNFEGGGIEHKFSIVENFNAAVYVGEEVNGAPTTSNSNISGKEIYQNIFKRIGGDTIPVKKVYTHYNIDSRVTKDFPAYVGVRKYIYPCLISEPITDAEAGQFDFMYYYFRRNWIYEDTVRTLTYDNNGSSYIEEKKIITYSNPDHALPNRIEIIDSKGRMLTSNLKYPLDYTISGTPSAAIAKGVRNLQNNNIIAPVIEKYVQRLNLDSSNLRTISASLTTYRSTTPVIDTIFGLELASPMNSFSPTIITATNVNKSINYKPKIAFEKYDSYGHLLQQHKISDILHSYLWNYQSSYPVAEVVNADSASVAYTSFEADNPGNWVIGTGALTTSGGITGSAYYTLSTGATISKAGLNAARSYIVTYWSKTGSLTVNGTIASPQFTKKGWTFYSHKLTSGATSVSITGSGIPVDELRLYPSDAQMTTYTYTPLVGMTSQCDAANRITYYEYDGLQRLKYIRDQDGNILRSYEYQYQASTSCGSNCSILQMTTLAGTNTLGYPVGVFNVNGKLLGNATNQSQYLNLWNADTANTNRGTLAAGGDPLHFQFTLIPGKTIPAITGCRYFQMDIAWNNINSIRSCNGAYIDFGDGTGMHLAAHVTDSLAVLAPNTTQTQAAHPEWNGYTWYYIHSYPDNSLKTLTFYHNDQSEISGLDNNGYPASSLPHLRNLRGNLPQYTDNLGGSCYQDSSMSTVAGITNWNTIHTIKSWGHGSGDIGMTPALHMGYAQDFMAGNKDLEAIGLAYPTFIGCFDSTFRISRLKSDWNTYFTHLKSIYISDALWNREDLSGLKELNAIYIIAGREKYTNDPTNNPQVPIPDTVIDNIFIQVAAGAGQTVTNGYMNLYSGGPNRTAASDAAVAALLSKGWILYLNGVQLH